MTNNEILEIQSAMLPLIIYNMRKHIHAHFELTDDEIQILESINTFYDRILKEKKLEKNFKGDFCEGLIEFLIEALPILIDFANTYKLSLEPTNSLIREKVDIERLLINLQQWLLEIYTNLLTEQKLFRTNRTILINQLKVKLNNGPNK